MDGVNAELYPLLIILLFMIIPIELHFLKLNKVKYGEFLEESSSLIQKKWIHHRTVIKDPQNNKGCMVIDELEWNTRLFGIANWIMYPILYVIFWNRHRRLKLLYI